MLRLLPFLLCFAIGLALGFVLFRRAATPAGDWERKYREILQRYRDLTRRLEDLDRGSQVKASLLRSSLERAAELLRQDGGRPPQAEEALRQIEGALKRE